MTTTARILDAAIDLYSSGGPKAVSFREIAREAGLALSVIQYHFSNKAQLLDATTRRAAERDRDWFTQCLVTVDHIPNPSTLPPGAVTDLIRSIVEQTVTQHRAPTSIWLALLIDSIRQGQPREVFLQGYAYRRQFWQDVARKLGFAGDDAGGLLFELATSLEIFLIALPTSLATHLYTGEAIRYLVYRLRNQAPPSHTGELSWTNITARATNWQRWQGAKDTADSDLVERMIDASADILLAQGVGGLTHRAVAARADASLSSTTYHFASIEDLLRQGYERICARLFSHLDAPDLVAGRYEFPLAIAKAIARVWLLDDPQHIRILAGLLDVHLAAARDPKLEPLIWGLTAELGAPAYEYLRRQSLLREPTPFNAYLIHILSLTAVALHFGQQENDTERFDAVVNRISAIQKVLFDLPDGAR